MKEYHYPDFMPTPGEPVIVRDDGNDDWKYALFDCYASGTEYPWICERVGWKFCAPHPNRLPILSSKKTGSLGQPNKRNSMDVQREKNKALFLARILAHTCRDERSCPAAAVGMECPFTGRCFCDDITSAHWYAYASKKEN